MLIDRWIEGLNVDCLLFDNVFGTYQATKHLTQQGHKRIAFFSLPRRLTPSHERADGYDQALREAGISFDPSLVVEVVLKHKRQTTWPSKFWNCQILLLH